VVGSRRVPVKDDTASAKLTPWVSPNGAGATLRVEM
jgi:hypothetical protein